MKRIWILLFVTSGLIAQPTAFEVATIKSSAPIDMAALRTGAAHIGTKIDGSHLDIGTASLYQLLCRAYRIPAYRLIGPDWLKTTMFDIQAKIPDGASPEQIPEMMQALLVERFGLKIHRDSATQPVYALVLAKDGPRMKVSAQETAPVDPPPPTARLMMSVPTFEGQVRFLRTPQGVIVDMPDGEIPGNILGTIGAGSPPVLHLESTGMTMKTLAELLSLGVLDRPVVDKTGLAGGYDVAVDISAEESMNLVRQQLALGQGLPGGGEGNSGETSLPAGSSISSSIPKLGLRLETQKLPIDVLVVDHIDKLPAAN